MYRYHLKNSYTRLLRARVSAEAGVLALWSQLSLHEAGLLQLCGFRASSRPHGRFVGSWPVFDFLTNQFTYSYSYSYSYHSIVLSIILLDYVSPQGLTV